ncbi:MAG: tetratricopeptide repeat-containing protein [Proteobacteria bacterium]|nr:tetratricopeptide repeat-containing protein [Pseudomonadota bacterium]MBU4296606.1 tetratricopeptide repeat-containing protein [Pseudomonadota bacterium]MCG2748235.1 tetratricopeptide repeat-containing protein [Desulfobulbaceae bacterium]
MDDQASYDKLATRIAAQVREVTGALGDIRPLVTPSWFPNTPTGSARFVGRLRHMWQIHDALWRGQTVIGQLRQGTALAQLVGGGGMGKSLLAEEYALRYGTAYPGGVFWLSARTAAESGATASTGALTQQREQQWRNLAAWLGMEIKNKSLVQIEGELHTHFARQNQPFLWVIDDVPADVPMQDLQSWYAPHPLGKTLLTSRSHEYEALGGMVDVGVLAEPEARSLLTQQRPPVSDAEAAAVDGILTALGRHALAVDVAAARLKGKPYPEFLADLHKPDTDALDLARRFAGQLPNGHEASIAVTLLQSIDNVNETTRDFLRLAAVLAVAPISRRLVARVLAAADGINDSDAQDRADLALHQAREQSLAEDTGVADFSVTVHILVTRTMRFRAVHPERSAALRAAAVQALTAELAGQADDIRHHATLVNWIIHARFLVVGMDDDLATGMLCAWIAHYDYVRGAYAAARTLQEQVLAMRRRVQGDEHPDTLTIMNNLAATLRALGDLNGARLLQEEVLAVSRRVLGDEHLDTLRDMNNLGETMREMGVLTTAKALHAQALAGYRRVFGSDHPCTLTVTNNLALTLAELGDFSATLQLQEDLLSLSKRVLGDEHPDTLGYMNNLAVTFAYLKEFSAACKLQEQVLTVRQRVLGEDHPETLRSMNNLAGFLASSGEFGAARELFKQALVRRCRVLGQHHTATMNTAWSLLKILAQEGLQDQAKIVMQEYLAWLMDIAPETLSSDQRKIRDRLNNFLAEGSAAT